MVAANDGSPMAGARFENQRVVSSTKVFPGPNQCNFIIRQYLEWIGLALVTGPRVLAISRMSECVLWPSNSASGVPNVIGHRRRLV